MKNKKKYTMLVVEVISIPYDICTVSYYSGPTQNDFDRDNFEWDMFDWGVG